MLFQGLLSRIVGISSVAFVLTMAPNSVQAKPFPKLER